LILQWGLNNYDFFGRPNNYIKNLEVLCEGILTMNHLENDKIYSCHSVLAIDGSYSMRKFYSGVPGPFGAFSSAVNLVEPVARGCGEFLANRFDNKVTLFYWACGYVGDEIEEIGNLGIDEVCSVHIGGPVHKKWGRGNHLLPAIKCAVGELKKYDEGLAVFITDGIWTDHKEVKEYTLQIAREMADGMMEHLRLVIVGVGDEVSEDQLEDLRNMSYGGLIDSHSKEKELNIWKALLASEIEDIEELISD